MRILLLSDGISPFVIGGMQKHSYYLAKFLSLEGHQVTLVHCVYGQNLMPDNSALEEAFGAEAMKNLEIIGLRFPPASWYPGHYLKESYMYSRQIFDRVRSRISEFDFIYAKGFSGWYFLEKKSKGMKMAPVAVKFHGYEMFQEPANLKSRIHNWMLKSPVLWNNRHADFIFSYGGKITTIIRELGIEAKRIIEIPTGIESSWIREERITRAMAKRSFAFVGRYERRKGIEELIAALRGMSERSDFEFHFIGPLPQSSRINRANIHYHGAVKEKSEIVKILDQCDVLVVPSHSEGMPNVIMEGMARGLAILATDVGAIASVVDSTNGWFVRPGDSSQLQHVLQEIMDMKAEDLAEKRRASLSKIHAFTWEEIAKRTSDAMKQLTR